MRTGHGCTVTIRIDHDTAALRSLLARDAARLSAGRRLPIDLPLLLHELGIALAPDVDGGDGSRHGRLRRTASTWEIAFNPASNPSRQRFTIAHELGHYLIEARVGVRPGNSAEYWALERECQTFAGLLLVPDRAVTRALSPRPVLASDLADRIEQLEAAAEVALEAAARRAIDVVDRPVAVAAIDVSPVGRRSGPPTLMWLHGNQPWIEAGRGTLLRRGHILSPATARARSLQVGERADLQLPGATQAGIARRDGFVLLAAFLEAAGKAAVQREATPAA